ncbi:MAG: oligoendopeptidase F [Candidatus Eisenbacteria bacterium]|nr:oligoendopeptidase F [Candidatus Eisenbacteria bacterium]
MSDCSRFAPRPASLLAALAVLLAAAAVAAAAPDPAPLPAYTPDANTPRSAVPDVYKWDLSPMFASDAAWEQGRVALLADIPQLSKYKGRLADPKALLACLGLYFRLHGEVNRLTLYANLRQTTAQSDDRAGAMNDHGLAAMDRLTSAASFIRREVQTLSRNAVAKAFTSQPKLAPYRAYVEGLRRRAPRLLSPDAERALGLLGDNLWAEIDLNEIPSALETCHSALLTDIPWPVVKDAHGKDVQLTLSNYSLFRQSPSRDVRKGAVEALLATLRQYQRSLATTLAGQFKLDVAYARARNYDTALEAYTDKDEVSTAVYDNLVRTVNAHLPLLHRYMALRKQTLGLPELHLYDLYIPLTEEVQEDVPYAQAEKTLVEALAPLGPAYTRRLAEGLDPHNGWLDLYPHKDKDSGASSSNVYGAHPFVKMNYQDKLDDMSTLAHEMGHALHSDMAMKAQSYPDARYVTFLAEIASTCNEALLNDYLVAHSKSDAEKAYLLVDRLETMRGTIFRQTLFAEFERAVHGYVEKGVPVTATLLDSTYSELVRRYYGPAYTLGENDGMEWAYIPHFFFKYYVYQYATGLTSGIAIADRVRQLGPPAAEAYLGMLKGGCSEPPLTLLRKAGVDLTQPAPIEAAMHAFERTLGEVEKLVGKK